LTTLKFILITKTKTIGVCGHITSWTIDYSSYRGLWGFTWL